MRAPHTGQLFKDAAHRSQESVCPQGMNAASNTASMHILHSFLCKALEFSTCSLSRALSFCSIHTQMQHIYLFFLGPFQSKK